MQHLFGNHNLDVCRWILCIESNKLLYLKKKHTQILKQYLCHVMFSTKKIVQRWWSFAFDVRVTNVWEFLLIVLIFQSIDREMCEKNESKQEIVQWSGWLSAKSSRDHMFTEWACDSDQEEAKKWELTEVVRYKNVSRQDFNGAKNCKRAYMGFGCNDLWAWTIWTHKIWGKIDIFSIK